MEKFNVRMAEAMKMRGMKQVDLCAATGIPKSAMSQYLSGRIKPKQDRICELAEVLGVEPGWLLGFDDVELSDEEKRLIFCYRNDREIKVAIDEIIYGQLPVFRAAKSKGGVISPSVESMSKERLARLKSAPETDENL